MMKISKLADYAVVILVSLAQSDESLMSAAGISLKTHLPEPTVAKILKILSKNEMLESLRGANGGYKLVKSASNITVADIVSAVDGPISLASCVDNNTGACDFEAGCMVKGRWDSVNRAVRGALEGVTLADMMSDLGQRYVKSKNEEGTHERYI